MLVCFVVSNCRIDCATRTTGSAETGLQTASSKVAVPEFSTDATGIQDGDEEGSGGASPPSSPPGRTGQAAEASPPPATPAAGSSISAEVHGQVLEQLCTMEAHLAAKESNLRKLRSERTALTTEVEQLRERDTLAASAASWGSRQPTGGGGAVAPLSDWAHQSASRIQQLRGGRSSGGGGGGGGATAAQDGEARLSDFLGWDSATGNNRGGGSGGSSHGGGGSANRRNRAGGAAPGSGGESYGTPSSKAGGGSQGSIGIGSRVRSMSGPPTTVALKGVALAIDNASLSAMRVLRRYPIIRLGVML